MIRITDLQMETKKRIDKKLHTLKLFDPWAEVIMYPFPDLVTLEVHPAVDIHIYYDHITLYYHAMTVDIKRNEFGTLICT